jgi:heme-degrading monooxygenase HmoA
MFIAKLHSSRSGFRKTVISTRCQGCIVSPSQKPEAADLTLYSSHAVWENRVVFEAWTKSEAFRAAP